MALLTTYNKGNKHSDISWVMGNVQLTQLTGCLAYLYVVKVTFHQGDISVLPNRTVCSDGKVPTCPVQYGSH